MTRPEPIRESVTTIGRDGTRRFLQPSIVFGSWWRARRAVAWLLIAFFAALPWVEIEGFPAVFLDIEHRRFHLLGTTLGLGDLWLLFFVITGWGFLIYATTALLGRIWCGWTCPQTVYLEHVFRVLDRLFEGDHVSRAKLDEKPWSDPSKLLRRGGRMLAYLVFCWAVAHIFLAYFISIPGLYPMITDAPLAHPAAFVAMAVATGVLFFNFWWFREQLCLIICPYGRLQSALIDDDSVIVGYDEKRGEPRGKAAPGLPVGDCVDCRRCVQVCPTGIDIRQGLQMECIACTACVDACDDVMTKLKRPTGLVRYASLRELDGGKTRFLRPRTILYAAMLVVGLIVATVSVLRVQPAGFKLSRPPQTELYAVSSASVANVFRAKIQNKDEVPRRFFISAESAGTKVAVLNQSAGMVIEPQAEITLPLTLLVDRQDYRGEFNFTLRLRSEDGKISILQKAHFIGPDPRTLQK
jgi:cytochrome c oxidase accessory protein FixG